MLERIKNRFAVKGESSDIDYSRLTVDHPNFKELPSGYLNRSFQILDVNDEDLLKSREDFNSAIERGVLLIRDNEVFYMGETIDGDKFIKGSIDLETGWVESDFPYGRAGEGLLWIAREIGGWEDPSGKSSNVQVSNELKKEEQMLTARTTRNAKSKNPFVPRSKGKHG